MPLLYLSSNAHNYVDFVVISNNIINAIDPHTHSLVGYKAVKVKYYTAVVDQPSGEETVT